MEKETYRVPEQNLSALQTRLDKLSRRAVRLGLQPISLQEVGEAFVLYYQNLLDPVERTKKVEPHNGETVGQAKERITEQHRHGDYLHFLGRRYVLVQVEGEAPKIAGWAFVATLEHSEAGNILRMCPPYALKSLPTEYRREEPWCDHCKRIRRRKDTYIISHEAENGRMLQVGRSCLRDFTGHASPERLADYAQLWSGIGGLVRDAEDEGWGGSHGEEYHSLEMIATAAATVIRLEGWVSRKTADAYAKEDYAGPRATASTVAWLHSGSISAEERRLREKYKAEDGDIALAQQAIAWAKALPDNAENDYLWNLRVVAHKEYITYRHYGLVCAMVSSYQREMNREAERKAKPERLESKHFGEIKKRSNFVLTLISTIDLATDYGCSTLHRFIDEEGNVGIWFASGERNLCEVGDKVEVKATVKAHDFWKNRKQTKLSRMKLIKMVKEADKPEEVAQ